jgi:hypothetical protein
MNSLVFSETSSVLNFSIFVFSQFSSVEINLNIIIESMYYVYADNKRRV